MTSTWTARVIGAEAGHVFAALTALAVHRDLIPFTRIEAPARPVRRGDHVVATSLGLLRDAMLVSRAQAPHGHHRGVVVFEKLGPVLFGRARIAVTPLGAHTCRVDWIEDVHLAGPARWLAPLLDRVLAMMTRRALRLFDRQLRLPAPNGIHSA